MALQPQPKVQVSSDKLLHMVAFGLLAALAHLAYPGSHCCGCSALSIFGALIELLQAIPLHCDSDVMDWLADTLAAAAVIGILQGKKRKS